MKPNPILALFGIIALALLAYTVFMYSTSASVDIAQAQAQIETAKAAQEAARAAQIAGAGLASSSVLMAVILVMIVFNVTMIIGFMLYVRMRPMVSVQPAPKSKWLPGPNAHWGKVGDGAAKPALEAGSMSTDDIFKAWMISQMTGGGNMGNEPMRPSLPAKTDSAPVRYEESEDDDIFGFARR